MSDEKTQFMLRIAPGDEVDAEELAEVTRQLQDEIAETDVDSVGPAQGGALPEGARAADPVTLGALIITLSASGGVLTTLIGAIQAFLLRNEKHSVTIEDEGGAKITITGHSTEEEKRLLREWTEQCKGTS